MKLLQVNGGYIYIYMLIEPHGFTGGWNPGLDAGTGTNSYPCCSNTRETKADTRFLERENTRTYTICLPLISFTWGLCPQTSSGGASKNHPLAPNAPPCPPGTCVRGVGQAGRIDLASPQNRPRKPFVGYPFCFWGRDTVGKSKGTHPFCKWLISRETGKPTH